MNALLLIAPILLLTSCTTQDSRPLPPLEPKEGEESSRKEPEPEPKPVEGRTWETKNVSHQGKVVPSGISIYMEGTHRLQLPNGQFVLLESDAVDLNGYTGEEVEAFGTTRPSIEGGAIVMRVERMKLLKKEVEPEGGTGTSVSSRASCHGEPCRTTRDEDTEESNDSKESQPSPSAAAQPSLELRPAGKESEETEETKTTNYSLPTTHSTEAPQPAITSEMELQASAMAKDTFEDNQWTQEYCTAHIGFCIPIHRNWWYKSFGTTTSAIWHIEIGNKPILNLGDGVIILNLVSGSLESDGALDPHVQREGNVVTGYRSWQGKQHFEVTAPALLETPVRYLLEHLTEHQKGR